MRGRSELARKVGVDRRTIEKHLRKIPRDAFFRDPNSGKMFLKRDVSVVPELNWAFEKGKALYSYRNVPKGKEIGLFRCDSDEDPEKLMSIFSPLESFFFDIDPFLLRHVFRYALREKLVPEGYFSGEKDVIEISDEELSRLWRELFEDSERAMITFSINPQELLEWIKGDGRDDLRRALPKEVWAELCREASELWKQREEFDKKWEKWQKWQKEGKQE